jgi:hypothetical protein
MQRWNSLTFAMLVWRRRRTPRQGGRLSLWLLPDPQSIAGLRLTARPAGVRRGSVAVGSGWLVAAAGGITRLMLPVILAGDDVYDSVDANRGAAVPVHQVHPQPVLVDPVVAPDRQLKRPCTAVIPGGQVSRISRKEVEAELWVWSISRSSNSMTGLPETRETWRAHNVQTSQSLLAGGRQPTAIP